MADGVVGVVAGLVLGLVHADEFEEEVGEGGEVEALSVLVRGRGEFIVAVVKETYDGDDHAGFVFSAGKEGGHEKDDDCDGDGGDGEVEFRFFTVDNDDEELDGEAEEKKEVELEEGDVNLGPLIQ